MYFCSTSLHLNAQMDTHARTEHRHHSLGVNYNLKQLWSESLSTFVLVGYETLKVVPAGHWK